MKKGTKPLVALAILLVIIGLIVPVQVHPRDDFRIIIDHTKKVYVAPACFDDADVTNNLEETTLKHALHLQYEPESSCTSEELVPVKKPFLIAIFQ